MSAAGEAEDACVSRAKPRPAERASAATAVHCAPMEAAMRGEAESLLAEFLRGDDHYLASSPVYGDGGAEALARALDLFLARPAIGFVWLAFADTVAGRIAVGACVACYAISTSRGTVVVNALSAHLTAQGITRIDCGCHRANTGAWRFYERLGFLPLDEERIALLL